MMEMRIRLQLEEAWGSNNRWFCSEAFGREINDLELLLIYYIKSGGAADFARRFDEAMGKANRWYCSEYFLREVSEPQILWDYYVKHAPVRNTGRNPRIEAECFRVELSIAC
jgi:hypothetical protein